ncbi:MAG: mannose-1-phosphate guanylyltransferase [Phycisphaerae bacterium]|nr:mannose-1-phosphate guanylyltransferase [Phycisphaerae bacterium]
MRHAVIMAGGAGTRLWPLSRSNRPKQLLPLIHGRNLLDLAVERLSGLFEYANILIVTSAEYTEQIASALPQLPRQNVVGEPVGRDTANAIALAAQLLAARDADATMAVFTADHVIRPTSVFVQAVRTACESAEQHPDALVTFGIRPTWPHTGLGYIHCSQTVADGVRQVVGFKEKPDRHTARRYVESGEHYWNSGMFVWKIATVRDALTRYLPNSMEKLAAVCTAAAEGRDYAPILREVYPQLEKISIDFAVMEKAPRVLMVELKCDWLDVGSWPAVENIVDMDEAGNAVVAQNTAILDSFRNVIVTEDDHLLAMVGIDDCIVVHSPDATLVCNKSDSQRLKELVELIRKKYGQKYL